MDVQSESGLAHVELTVVSRISQSLLASLSTTTYDSICQNINDIP